jgi:hypothetical protein
MPSCDDFDVEMPKIVFGSLDKDKLQDFIPYLVWNKENEEQSTILVHKRADTVIWFDQDGWVGHSGLPHLMEDKYIVVRVFEKGEKLILTRK